MIKHLRPIGNSNKFCNLQDWLEDPPQAPEGWEWVDGYPPPEATIQVPGDVAGPLIELFNALPGAARAQFYTTYAGVKVAIENQDLEAAQLIIQGATVSEELEAVKTQMLALFA